MKISYDYLRQDPLPRFRRKTRTDATARQIDQLVDALYGLTDEEIRIVEEATAH